LGCGELLDELAAGVSVGESDAKWLRGRQSALGSLADVVREACGRWEKGT
jgi:gamma-glutamyl:cysteine ligase YbdK (ATP-grasp superfamily)